MNHIYIKPVHIHDMWVLEVRTPTYAKWHQGNLDQPSKPFEISYLNVNDEIDDGGGEIASWTSETDARQYAIETRAKYLDRIRAREMINQNVKILSHPAVIIQ